MWSTGDSRLPMNTLEGEWITRDRGQLLLQLFHHGIMERTLVCDPFLWKLSVMTTIPSTLKYTLSKNLQDRHVKFSTHRTYSSSPFHRSFWKQCQ